MIFIFRWSLYEIILKYPRIILNCIITPPADQKIDFLVDKRRNHILHESIYRARPIDGIRTSGTNRATNDSFAVVPTSARQLDFCQVPLFLSLFLSRFADNLEALIVRPVSLPKLTLIAFF